jgi:phosphatidate cytidylyltransferase
MALSERHSGISQAFDHPVTVTLVAAIAIGLVIASVLVRVLYRARSIDESTHRELIARIRSWYVLSAAMVLPILLGAAWVWLFFLILSLFCFREFARATSLDKSRPEVCSVVAAILLTYFAVADNWMGLFSASGALGIALIFVVALLPDEPPGYLRRVSLAIIGFALFGISLGHLAFLSNDALFRPMLLWLLVCTELNDVFAYLAGKSFGRRKLLPKTSPNKTVAGALGAIVLTTLLAASVGHFVFQSTALDTLPHLIALGMMISILGQFGDLVVSSIKRDLGIKDMSDVIPGHGGLLDRFDSLLIVAPCVFHYINYFRGEGIGWDQPIRIISTEIFPV